MPLEEHKFSCMSCGKEINLCLYEDSGHKDYRSVKTREGAQVFLCIDCFKIEESLKEQWEDYEK